MDLAVLKTPLGFAVIEGDENGLASIKVTDEVQETGKTPESLKNVVDQLREYFEGKRTTFDLKLNPQGTDFQKEVWKGLQEIPFGKTTSYQEFARRLGDVKAIRAVAAANGKNPLWVVVPCHRVIGKNGDLVGYAGGLGRKKWLLEHESPVKQQKLF